MSDELRVVRRLALDYVNLLYAGKIYTFTGHNMVGNCTKTCNTWTCDVSLYCMGPKISILEVNIEYNNPQEYFVTGFT